MLAAGTRGPSNGHVELFGPGRRVRKRPGRPPKWAARVMGARRGTQNSRPVIEP